MNQELEGPGLVVFFSALGHTQKLAEAIARSTGFDIEAIQDSTVRHVPPRGLGGWLSFVRLVHAAATGKQPQLLPLQRDPARYRVVVVGSPVWGGVPASPARAFLAAHGSGLQQAAYFWTGGAAVNPTMAPAMAAASGREPVASLGVSARQVSRGQVGEQVHAMAQELARFR